MKKINAALRPLAVFALVFGTMVGMSIYAYTMGYHEGHISGVIHAQKVCFEALDRLRNKP